MLAEFKKYYIKLPKNLQFIIEHTILNMKKEHRIKRPKKRIKIPQIINYYRKQKGLTVEKLIEKCNEPYSSEIYPINTYKAIIKRNLAKPDNNAMIKRLIEVLDIPTDKNGNIIFIKEKHNTISINNKKITCRAILFDRVTKEYFQHIFEFQRNSVFENFLCLEEKNQKAIVFLTRSLYFNQFAPEQFMDDDFIWI